MSEATGISLVATAIIIASFTPAGFFVCMAIIGAMALYILFHLVEWAWIEFLLWQELRGATSVTPAQRKILWEDLQRHRGADAKTIQLPIQRLADDTPAQVAAILQNVTGAVAPSKPGQ